MQYRSSHSVNTDIQNINTMENLILKAIYYMSKISKKKVVEDSIKGYITLTIIQIFEALNQLQGKGLIYR